MFSNMMIRNIALFPALAAAATLLISAPSIAAPKPTSLGTFKDWTAYTYKKGSKPVCYIVSQPISSSPKGLNRDPAFFIITHRPGDGVRNEANTIIGYPFKKGSTASVVIDSAAGFKFFTSGDGAWAGSKGTDNKVVGAMKGGSTMVIRGRSGRGTKTTDKYSLAGITAAMKAIDSTCRK